MMGFGFGGLDMIFVLISWVAIVGLAVWLVSLLFPRAMNTSPTRPGGRHTDPPDSARGSLKRRPARGEISKPEVETPGATRNTEPPARSSPPTNI